eukprot:CAMPEP_0114503500 /NCGR_PEP_ID=MMETSP0109-20121206/9681_1 /TAXON_ID=29199 /ORGANISM="Chlorarachnion reptans, Strain CCCM449" /LENGTH=248 /DNA_ID=CAMNT_0001681533 /DNA_START=215 /DNA_END=961 /DNA_ORIENTATION=-
MELKRGRLWIIDGAIPNDIWADWLQHLEYSKKDLANRDYSLWHFDLQKDHATGRIEIENPVLDHVLHGKEEELKKIIAAITLGYVEDFSRRNMRLLRAYTNFMAKSDSGLYHEDDTNPGFVSAVWYCHPEWHLNWGGEMMIFDSPNGSINMENMHDFSLEGGSADADIRAVPIFPNRLIIFDSSVIHSARPPQKTGFLRLSTAFKYGTVKRKDRKRYRNRKEIDTDSHPHRTSKCISSGEGGDENCHM